MLGFVLLFPLDSQSGRVVLLLLLAVLVVFYRVRAFAAKLQEATGLPCLFWDERLSSSAVESFLIKEADLSRAKRKKVLDAGAAAYILQGALDRLGLM